MPDNPPASFTESEIMQLMGFLAGKGAAKACRYCGGADYAVTPAHVPAGVGADGNVKVIPMGVLMCKNCGNTQFFNLIVAGMSVTEAAG